MQMGAARVKHTKRVKKETTKQMQVSKKHCAEHILKSLGKEQKEVVQKKKEETENKLNLACRTQKHAKKNEKINTKLGMILVHRRLKIGQNAGRNQIQHRRNRRSSFHRDRKGTEN